jgi:hypothetical protein
MMMMMMMIIITIIVIIITHPARCGEPVLVFFYRDAMGCFADDSV